MIIHGDCFEIMKKYSNNHFTNILTDPPYGLRFMNKAWDYSIPGKEYWIELLRVSKPGALMLCFGGTRTYHRLACEIEDAGWEIRDCLMWIYGSGFPKSHNHFGIEGYGTTLKPAYEPIIMAMKPLDGTFKQNGEKWGVAGINIDACRIEHHGNIASAKIERSPKTTGILGKFKDKFGETTCAPDLNKGRWPANTLFDEQAAEMLDEQSGFLKSGYIRENIDSKSKNKVYSSRNKANINEFKTNSGGASRFFYCAKASPSERIGNNHPTVKPLKLLEYLLKLITPPKNALVLDPFAGSGSTLVAAQNLGIACEGIEISEEYCEIARKRCERPLTLF